MAEENVDPDLIAQLKKLQAKYDAMGQDISSYLDGLLYSDYLTYWEYIHLDTLLSLESPKTQFPDEKIFIRYHQITELFFDLIRHELDQIAHHVHTGPSFLLERLDRIIRYFENLERSFDIMTVGMEKDQFLKFRMALLPASGFQSAQYRLIEIASTDLTHLVNLDERAQPDSEDLNLLIQKLYWRRGATEMATGKKTLTLQQFEQKYMALFLDTAQKYKHNNLYQIYKRHFAQHPEEAQVRSKLREYDHLANVLWRLAHMKASGNFLHKSPHDLEATGGTNWQRYLPPRFQKIMFFPELWTAEEKEEWGKGAVMRALGADQPTIPK